MPPHSSFSISLYLLITFYAYELSLIILAFVQSLILLMKTTVIPFLLFIFQANSLSLFVIIASNNTTLQLLILAMFLIQYFTYFTIYNIYNIIYFFIIFAMCKVCVGIFINIFLSRSIDCSCKRIFVFLEIFEMSNLKL